MKVKEDAVYVVAILFTFILGLYATSNLVHYSQTNYEFKAKYEYLVSLLHLPESFIDKINSDKSLRSSLSYIDSFVAEDLLIILIKNSGDAPLFGFSVYVNGIIISPNSAPDILYQDSKGTIIVEKSKINNAIDNTIQIKTDNGAEVRVVVPKSS